MKIINFYKRVNMKILIIFKYLSRWGWLANPWFRYPLRLYLCFFNTHRTTLCGLYWNYAKQVLVTVSKKEGITWWIISLNKTSKLKPLVMITGDDSVFVKLFKTLSSNQFNSENFSELTLLFTGTFQRCHMFGSSCQVILLRHHLLNILTNGENANIQTT